MSQDSESERLRQATAHAQAVAATHRAALMGKPNVVGVGVGLCRRGGEITQEVGIVILVSRKLPASSMPPSDLLPREIDGVRVDVQEVGKLRAAPEGGDEP